MLAKTSVRRATVVHLQRLQTQSEYLLSHYLFGIYPLELKKVYI